MDPLFGESEFVAGPQSIYAYRHKTKKYWVYLIGENHEIPGSPDHEHLVDFINAKSSQVHLFIEKGKNESLFAADIVHSTPNTSYPPLMRIAHDYLYTNNKYRVTTADVRRDPPFHILEAIYQFGSYLQIHELDIYDDKPKITALRNRFKKFEKDVFQNILSRRKCMKFLKEMTLPEKPTPGWYQTWLDEFMKEVPVNKLKDELRKHQSADWYQSIHDYVDYNWDFLVKHNDDYSIALHNANATWHSQSKNMVADKHFELRWYFAVLFGVLMEMFILVSIRTSDAKIKIALMGADHCTRLRNYFDKQDEFEFMYHAYSANKQFIDLKYNKQDFKESPFVAVKGLKQFIQRRNKKKVLPIGASPKDD